MVGPVLTAATEADAVAGVRAYLDGEATLEIAARGPDGYPSAFAVAGAFAQIRPSDKQLVMLVAHLRAPDGLLTATELARAAGYATYETANSQYGGLGRMLAEELGWTPELRESDGQPIWTLALATDGGQSERGEFRWRLRPEVAQAAQHLR